ETTRRSSRRRSRRRAASRPAPAAGRAPPPPAWRTSSPRPRRARAAGRGRRSRGRWPRDWRPRSPPPALLHGVDDEHRLQVGAVAALASLARRSLVLGQARLDEREAVEQPADLVLGE